MRNRFIYIIIYLLGPFWGFSQELSYVHYNTRDGLAGSTIYDMCQDRDGFIWFGTENGLSRFDGTSFQNFTVKDGLPDNEVLKVFADSHGRVWIGTFSKEICYYYNGRIFNRNNDTLLKNIVLNNSVAIICEDKEGEVMINDQSQLIVIFKDNHVERISDRPEFIPYKFFLFTFPNYFDGGFFVVTNSAVYKYINRQLIYFYRQAAGVDKMTLNARLFSNGELIRMIPPSPIINYDRDTNYVVKYIGTVDGAWTVDADNRQFKEQFLKGKKISWVMEDSEKNIWFASFGEGVYKLPSKNINTIVFGDKQAGDNTEVFSIAMKGDSLFAGLGVGKAALISKKAFIAKSDYLKTLNFSDFPYHSNRLYSSKVLSSGIIILCFDNFIVKIDKDKYEVNYMRPVKSVEEINSEYIAVGTYRYAVKVRVKDLKIVDSIWMERSTKVFYNKGFYYIGTLDGLYKVKEEDDSHEYLGKIHPSLSRRINDIKATKDGTLWFATNDEGIVAFKDDSVKAIINESSGLSSNICKTLFLQNDYLWVGTNKGLNKINIRKAGYPIIKYSSSDGLPSDIINSVYADDSVIWVGSPAGLTYFTEKQISTISICNLKLLKVLVSGIEMPLQDHYELSHKDNNISFEFAGISFKSGGDMIYRYRLSGLDNSWNETRQNTLTYPSLPAGDYELQLAAVNKFGISSEMISIKFSIHLPFWKSWWFYALLILLPTILTIWLANARNKKVRSRLEEKSRVEQQFAILEQQALQAQMNPHFIFNCLNSIQQYILTNDKETANRYLTGFASLVRQTLDSSEKKTITVAEEVRYLKQYLEMEKMRFGDNFSYRIAIDPSLKTDYLEIPALLLQPYVENCLRHGIRHKSDGLGKVDIRFFMEGEVLYCSVRDNGVGRKRASELKSFQHIEYQSKGMGLAEKRVMLLNKTRNNKISIEIIDLAAPDGSAAGTEVILKIPM